MISGVKICGISDLETLKFIINHPKPPQFIGFISNYKKSKRYVDLDTLRRLTAFNNNKSNFVSVLVNPDNEILEKIKNLNFNYYQLYNVSPERTEEIRNKYKIKIISAITVTNEKDVNKYNDYLKISEIILFDSKGYDKSESFDHSLLKDVPRSLKKMIAGNIQIDDIPNFKNTEYMIDISGALEDDSGKKDIKKIDKFLNTVHNINT
tara:strand:+ start:1180 stop:1803 length:624 start_codon:yes stop_codon:yes gene_type:complete